MRGRHWRSIAAAILLLSGATAHADCVQSAATVSSSGTFPNRYAAAVAWNGSVLGVTKNDSDPTFNAIYFAAYDTNFNQLSPDRKIVDASLSGASALLWTGSEFGLFYVAPNREIVLQRLDASGNPIGGPIPIRNHPPSNGQEFDVIWSPARNAYALARTVTFGSDAGVWLTTLSNSGAVLSDVNVSIFVSPPTLPRVASLADGTLALAWARVGDPPLLAYSVVSPTNTVKSVLVSNRDVVSSVIASDGTTALLIYSAKTTSGTTELRYAQYDANATPLIADSPFLTGTGVDIVPFSLTWNPLLAEWALVYSDVQLGVGVFPGETRLHRFTLAGASSDTLLSDLVHSRLIAPFPLVFANGGYITSLQRVLSRAEGSESYLTRYCPFFVVASADRTVVPLFVPVTFTASPSGGAPGYSFVWDFGDLSQQPGRVVQHSYTHAGTYTVTLTGTDAAGARSVSTLTVQVVPQKRRAVK